MVHQLMFDPENHERIHAVENSFGPWGKPLSQPGRVLIGQGHLKKQSRRGPQPKVFFLFNDVLVYGSVILRGHWYKNQQIIPLGEHLVLIHSSQKTTIGFYLVNALRVKREVQSHKEKGATLIWTEGQDIMQQVHAASELLCVGVQLQAGTATYLR